MRKLFLWMPFPGAIMLILFSCKKENLEADTPQNTSNEKLIPIIKSWLDEQIKDLPAGSIATVESLKLNLSYGEIRLEKYEVSKKFIVIPILSGFKSTNNADKNPANYLVLVFENQDSITRGNIIQYISSNGPKPVPQNSVSKIFTYRDLDCSGQFTILSITDYFKYELKFENGKLKYITDQRKQGASNDGIGRVNECIDWYEQTWYVWDDGSTELISDVYVYTTCDGDCWQPRVANGRSYGTSCNGSGGGGGNPIEYEYNVHTIKKWDVQRTYIYNGPTDSWYIVAATYLQGKKKASLPYGGHFISVSKLTLASGCTDCSLYNVVWTMTHESIIGGENGSHYATHHVAGNYKVGDEPPVSLNKHKMWAFEQVF